MYCHSLVILIIPVYLIALAASIPPLGLGSDRLVRGQSVQLTWTNVSQEHYPLSLEARFFNESSDGVFSIQTTVAVGLTGNSFKWEGVPSPLDYIPTARYELILLPEGKDEPRVGYEGLFLVVETDSDSESDMDSGENSSPGGSSSESEKGEGGKDDNDKSVALGAGLGLGLGIPIVVAAAWCMKRRWAMIESKEGLKKRT